MSPVVFIVLIAALCGWANAFILKNFQIPSVAHKGHPIVLSVDYKVRHDEKITKVKWLKDHNLFLEYNPEAPAHGRYQTHEVEGVTSLLKTPLRWNKLRLKKVRATSAGVYTIVIDLKSNNSIGIMTSSHSMNVPDSKQARFKTTTVFGSNVFQASGVNKDDLQASLTSINNGQVATVTNQKLDKSFFKTMKTIKNTSRTENEIKLLYNEINSKFSDSFDFNFP